MSQHYIECPTCSNCLAINYVDFMLERDHNAGNEKITPEEKKDVFSKLLDKYGFEKRCCRMRIMGQNYNSIPNLISPGKIGK